MSWLNHDHKNFESAVFKCRNACDEKDWPQVQTVFGELESSYRTHVRIEEEVLFPAYEARPGAATEPTSSLKADHTQIFHLMDHISKQLDQGSHDSLAYDFALLYRTLIKHHEKEEEIFLPMASEALLSDKETILADLKSLLEDDR